MKQVLKCPKRDPNDYINWYQGMDAPVEIIPYIYILNRYSTEWVFPLWKEMEALVGKGLTKAIGVSNWSPKRIEELLKVCKIPPAMLQIELHPGNLCSKARPFTI